MRRHRMAACLAVATATVGLCLSAVPPVSALEDSLGLRWLFQTRGNRPPPAAVVVVNIDEAAAARLDQPQTLRDWPRSTHARLLDRLVERGVSAVAFDVAFFRHGELKSDDGVFRDAIARAGRVALVEQLELPRASGVEISRRQRPIPILADSARGLAPVPVPGTPLVTWFWTFVSTQHEADVPTLSAVLLQLHALPVLERFVSRLKEAHLPHADSLPAHADDIRTPSELLSFMQTVRRGVQQDARARDALLARVKDDAFTDDPLVGALIALYAGSDTAYLNFYGPPGVICTLPYDAVYLSDASIPLGCPLKGALVLVGAGEGRLGGTGQPDTHHTIFESEDGRDFTGVEIHATALANLLTRTSVQPVRDGDFLGLLASFGILFGATGYYIRTRPRLRPGHISARLQAALVLLLVATGYAALATVLFSRFHIAVPLIVPLAVQLPFALILGLIVPPAQYEHQIEAVCLATDAAGSTAIGQQLPHDRYAHLLAEYNDALTQPVRARGGAILEPQGDGFVCLWYLSAARNDADADTRLRACRTALEIADASLRFDRRQPEGQQLPTRVGLNVGQVTIHSDADRGVFKAFGDAVNVAARLRDLNVELGTRVLANAAVVDGLEQDLAVRRVPGSFALKGVAAATAVVALGEAGAPPVPESPDTAARG